MLKRIKKLFNRHADPYVEIDPELAASLSRLVTKKPASKSSRKSRENDLTDPASTAVLLGGSSRSDDSGYRSSTGGYHHD